MTLKWLSSYAPADEEFDNVSVLLHGDGTNGSTTLSQKAGPSPLIPNPLWHSPKI